MGNSLMNRFTAISEWIYFLLVLQMYWWMGLVIGGIFFGIFPASYATFAVARKRLKKEDVSLNKEFWRMYQANFLKSQLEGWIWVFIGIFIYYDIRLLFSYSNVIGFIIGSLFVSLLIMYGICSMLILPIHSHFNLTVLNRVKLALIISVTFPHLSVGLCIGSIVLYFIASKIPLLFIMIGMSLTAILYTYLSSFAFQKVEKSGFIAANYASSHSRNAKLNMSK